MLGTLRPIQTKIVNFFGLQFQDNFSCSSISSSFPFFLLRFVIRTGSHPTMFLTTRHLRRLSPDVPALPVPRDIRYLGSMTWYDTHVFRESLLTKLHFVTYKYIYIYLLAPTDIVPYDHGEVVILLQYSVIYHESNPPTSLALCADNKGTDARLIWFVLLCIMYLLYDNNSSILHYIWSSVYPQ